MENGLPVEGGIHSANNKAIRGGINSALHQTQIKRMENGLPKGWEKVTLGAVCEKPQYGFTTKSGSAGKVRYLRTTDISSGKIDWESVPFCVDEPDDVSKYQLRKNDIVVSRAGSVGISYLIDEVPENAVFASYLIRFNTKNIPAKFIAYFLQSKAYWNAISEMSAGIAVPNVNASKLSELPIPLPPLPEQHRIVAKLDAVLAKVDSARGHLERLPGILQRFRQSVLAQAVSGKLTEGWREENGGGKWVVKNLDEIGDVTGGLTKNPGRTEFSKKIPYLRVANVYANRLELDEIKEIGVLESELARVLLKKNDLLIVEGNGSIEQIGRVSIWDGSIEPCAHQNHLIKVRFPENVDASFVLFYLLSQQGREQIEKVSSSTSGLNTLSLSKVSKLIIQVPPLPEQQEIVRRVQSLFAVADRLEERYEALKEKVEGLPQAVLGKAFRGELVPQEKA